MQIDCFHATREIVDCLGQSIERGELDLTGAETHVFQRIEAAGGAEYDIFFRHWPGYQLTIAVTCGDGERHSFERSTDRGLGRVEVAVRVEPHDAGVVQS